MAELLYRLGKASAKRAWIVIVAWAAVLGLAGGAFAVGFGTLATSFDVPGTASGEVIDELAEELPDYAGASGQVVYHAEDGEALTADQQADIAAVAEGLSDLPDVAQVVDPFETEQERADREQEIVDGRAEIEDGQEQLDAGQEQLDAALDDLEAGQEQLDA
ncbi:MAG TPA: RND transporter, partial [Microbacterium sp.]|nr:RND transporter [Microbacterium sp.]